MIASVYPGSRPEDIPSDAAALHLVRPVKSKTMEQILRKCPNLGKVTASRSCLKRLPGKCKRLLGENGVAIETEARPGRPISVPLQKMLHAMEMRKDYQSLREIERVTGISKSTVHYLEKYAQRAKVKNGKKVIYLK